MVTHLYNQKFHRYRFWHASRHEGRVLEFPKVINNKADLQNFMCNITTHDLWEWAKTYKPGSDWTVAAITSTTFFVDRMIDFPIGAHTGKEYRDILCFQRKYCACPEINRTNHI